MGKILAIIFLVVFAWFAIPHIAKAQWISPTLYPSYWWGASPVYQYDPVTANRGYGWFSLNIFGGRPAVQAGYIAPQPMYSGYSYYTGYPSYSAPHYYSGPSYYGYNGGWGNFGNW